VISRGDGRVEVSLESPASAGLFRFCGPKMVSLAEAVSGLESCAARLTPPCAEVSGISFVRAEMSAIATMFVADEGNA
jgi:hypothetical protein